MNSLNILLPYNYVKNLVNLTWSDILYGIEHGFLAQEAAIEHAIDIIGKEQESPSKVLDLACLDKSESICPHIVELSSQMSEQENNAQEKFLYVLLKWVYEHKELYTDPLEVIVYIYSDFDYPEEISSFVRYMPMGQPDLGSLELNIERLYNNWKDYLEKQRFRYSTLAF